MSLIIRRAKERFADRSIGKARLGPADAETDKERDHRNWFYRGHHFTCDFPDDPEHRVGYVYAKRIGDLQERVNQDKVTIVPTTDLFHGYVNEHNKAKQAEVFAASLRKNIEARDEADMKRRRFERWVWLSMMVCLAGYAAALHMSR